MRFSCVGNDAAGSIRGAAVVIDVLRAFTLAAMLLDRGATQLVLVDDVDDALALRTRFPDCLAVTDGARDPRFDLTNSPGQLLTTEVDVRGRTIVQRTTNGTAGALGAWRASVLLCAGLTTASATARFLRAHVDPDDDVTFVISGEHGNADEDLAAAELIAAKIEAASEDEARRIDPTPFVDRVHRSAAADDLRAGLTKGYTGIHPDDIDLACAVDQHDFAMEARVVDGELRLLRR